MTQLYPQALGSLFVASYDSQGYGGGIGPRLHTGLSRIKSVGPYSESLKGRDQLSYLHVRENNIKIDLEDSVWGCGLYTARSCERPNEPLAFVRDGEMCDELSAHQLLRKDSPQWS
jgi:hypothetical protein